MRLGIQNILDKRRIPDHQPVVTTKFELNTGLSRQTDDMDCTRRMRGYPNLRKAVRKYSHVCVRASPLAKSRVWPRSGRPGGDGMRCKSYLHLHHRTRRTQSAARVRSNCSNIFVEKWTRLYDSITTSIRPHRYGFGLASRDSILLMYSIF